ncbi:hypothetical protein AB1Z15_000510 [Vibrio parahaemolyticus]
MRLCAIGGNLRFSGYKVNPKHRKNKPKDDCTQWEVDEWTEIKLFTEGMANDWVCNDGHIWSIEHSTVVLGDSGNARSKPYYAKFVVDNNHEWHGYPVSSKRPNDRPPTKVLDSWQKDNLITKKQQNNITKGRE